MHKKDSIYYLSGKGFSKEALIRFCDNELADSQISTFKSELYLFIKEWFSSTKYIVAKTSGSTGIPKEIRLNKKHMTASAKVTISFFNLMKKDKVLLCLPLNFIAGKMMVVRALAGGLDLYISEPSSRPDIPEFQIQFSAMVPLQVANLVKEDSEAFSNIKKLIIGGSFIPEALHNEIQKMDTHIWQTYGMTETITHIALRKINGYDKSDMYSALPGVSLSLDNGCIVVDAPHLGISGMKTNDHAEMDHEGRFRITGRADNVIISGGLKFNPESIENKLSGIISNAYFIGSLDDHELGQKLVLFIEKGGFIERQIFNTWKKLEARLDRLEIPKEIIFIDFFTRTASEKIARKEITRNWKKSKQNKNNEH